MRNVAAMWGVSSLDSDSCAERDYGVKGQKIALKSLYTSDEAAHLKSVRQHDVLHAAPK